VARFPYVAANNLPTGLMPRLSMVLSLGGRSVEVNGLLDTGAAVNVLPLSGWVGAWRGVGGSNHVFEVTAKAST